MNQTIANCIKLLDEGQSILISFKCFPSISEAQKDGLVPIPDKDEPHVSNHAVNIIGYSTEQEVFKFVNSWGKEWGDNGCGYLPFYYFENNLVLEVFVIDFEERID